MAWNDAWGDDAFSPGRIPGLGWLAEEQAQHGCSAKPGATSDHADL